MHRQLAPAQLSLCSTELKLRAALAVYAALWTTTALAAAAVALAPGLAADARASLHGLGLNLRPHPATLRALLLTRLARSMAIAAAPAEWAAIGAGRSRRWRRVVDAGLTGHVGVDVLPMRKTRRWIWSLGTQKDYKHSVVDSIVHHLHAAGCEAAVQLVPCRRRRRRSRATRRGGSVAPRRRSGGAGRARSPG